MKRAVSILLQAFISVIGGVIGIGIVRKLKKWDWSLMAGSIGAITVLIIRSLKHFQMLLSIKVLRETAGMLGTTFKT